MMIQVLSFLQNVTNLTLGKRVDDANAKRWGLKDVDDLRIRHVTFALAGKEIPEVANEPGYPQPKKE
jgi:hypothetical protein